MEPALDLLPLGLEVVEVPLQLFSGAADAGGAHDGAHAVGDLQLVHHFPHLVAVFALDAAGNATGARVVRHQHEEAAGETDERGQGSALGAALFLLDLHHELLPFLQELADVHAPALGLRAEIIAGDFLQREEAVARSAVIDETGFERGFYAGDLAFVDVGLFLFSRRQLDT